MNTDWLAGAFPYLLVLSLVSLLVLGILHNIQKKKRRDAARKIPGLTDLEVQRVQDALDFYQSQLQSVTEHHEVTCRVIQKRIGELNKRLAAKRREPAQENGQKTLDTD